VPVDLCGQGPRQKIPSLAGMGERSKRGRGVSAPGGAAIRSFVDRTHHAVVARGRFDGLVRAYESHCREVGLVVAAQDLGMMPKALAAATLHLALLPPDQFCSFTLNLLDPDVNLFLAGDNNEFQVTGRVYTENVRTAETNRLYIETQRPKHEPARSVVDFSGRDVFEAFREYYRRSLQMRARLFDLGADEVVLIQGLPMVDEPWLVQLDVAGVRELVEGGLEQIEDRTYRFRCGCDVQRIEAFVLEVFAGEPEELFGGEQQAEVQCPRCGRGFVIGRRAFEPAEA
jgi:hypothetical protein